MAIRIEHLNYVYSEGTAFEKHALKDINLDQRRFAGSGMTDHTDKLPVRKLQINIF